MHMYMSFQTTGVSMSKQHQEFFQEDGGGGKGSSEGGHYVRTMPTTTEIGLAREPLGLGA